MSRQAVLGLDCSRQLVSCVRLSATGRITEKD